MAVEPEATEVPLLGGSDDDGLTRDGDGEAGDVGDAAPGDGVARCISCGSGIAMTEL